MPQQHNPGRHVQSLTLPQSRHNHRNTSAYIFPTVPTPRTTPPTPGTASPRRRAPTLQLPVATRPLHSRHSPAAAQRFHRSDASEHPADTGPRLAAGHCPASPPGPNAPTPRRNAPVPFKTLPCRRTPTPHRPDTSAPRRHRATPRRRALPRLSAGPQRSNSPSQRSRAIQDTPLPPNTDPTSSRHLGPPPTPGHASPPGTAPPLRRAPTLQLPVATRPPHSRHTPAAAQRFHRPDASDNPADTGTRHAPGTASPRRRAPTLQLPVATRPLHSRHSPAAAQRFHRSDASEHPADTGTRPAPGTKKSGSASRTYSFVSNFSVKNRRLHLAQTNALTQHNQSGAYPLINPCSHN